MKHKEQLEDILRMGMSELLILNLLKKNDLYGYEIKKLIRECTHNVFSFKRQASIYQLMYRMEERGLISSYSVTGKHDRKYYHIEKEGIDYLEYGRECGSIICTEFLNNMKAKEE